ncbi:MAG: phosphodiester glycosidase family protein [Armatimonadota bacterium]|nr:phosphodiester glycosidase family protein [Armatimonadota bacterium]
MGKNSPTSIARYFRQIRWQPQSDVYGAKHMRAISKWDGTQFDLFLFNSKSGVRTGLFDLDQHDRNPGDNQNYSFYGMNAYRSIPAIKRAAGLDGSKTLIAVCNGGLFTPGTDKLWRASHSSSLVYHRKTCYPVDRPAWTVGLRNDGLKAASIRFARSHKDLPTNVDYAICDVQALIVNGKPMKDRPMPLNDEMKMSRTSIAWDRHGNLFLLVVHELDSEAASKSQVVNDEPQTGGWSFAQLRKFWKVMNVPYAANLASGDSSQVVYKWKRSLTTSSWFVRKSGYAFIPSTEFAVTVGYFNNHPLKISIPTLPPYLMARGSLNYIYIYK